ncbi:uncharacterized protein LOC6541041 [Drosophila erecta]|uniref:Uncharacterized protein, isoform A n=1 Tax=Drosophila erecta TaxID=7220 RepID=B3N7K6_DROER|nr:uncharacterized protein LOC6541041 [Drosophila erecta]EDV59411.2 uncharacterized protein Dere_GG23419, isoform A [Drosophila erecta]KQS70801.1 uncharacterized protein Dere_GG23419, isoform B [Drosophila erecta]
MDSVKSFFAGSSKDGSLPSNRQPNVPGSSVPSRWGRSWSTSSQHTDPEPGPSSSTASKSGNPCDVKRKDSDNYFYIMWRA